MEAAGAEAAPATPAGTHDISLSTPWTAFDGNVNVVAGNLSFSQTDLTIPSIGFATTVGRTYNSAAAGTDGPFGHGWSWSLGSYVTTEPDGVEVVGDDGRSDHFVEGAAGTYVPPAGVHDTLTDLAGGGWLLVRRDQVRLSFSSSGRLTSIGDANGNGLYLTYSDGGLASALDTAQRVWTFDRDPAGRVAAVRDPAGRSVAYGYSADGDLTSVTDAAGSSTRFTYVDHRLTTLTDPNNHTSAYTYDAEGRVVTATDATGSATGFSYDEPSRHTTVTGARANVRTYDYDEAGRIVRLTNALGQVESWTWDASNNRVRVMDRNGGSTTSAYDARGNATSGTDAEGGHTSATFDEQNHPTSRTDALGRVTSLVYDDRGNLSQTTDANGRVTTFAYDLRGRLVASNNGNGNTTSFGYDRFGNQTSTTNALGHMSTRAYDAAGRVTSEADADGRTTSHSYDPVGRLLATTDGAGGRTAWAYDAAGNKTAVTDPRGNVTRMTYDAANRLTGSVDALGGVTVLALDANGNRTAVTDQLGNVTTFTYDALDRAVLTTDPNGHSNRVAYDAVGNRTAATDALGRTTGFRYDRLHRLVGVEDPAGGHATYAYDAVGNRIATTDPNGNTTRTTFDPLDRPVAETDPLAHASAIRYDAVGNVVGKTDANGAVTRFTYDAADRMVRADYAEGAVVFAYDRAGNRVGVTDTGGTTTSTYDGAKRLTSNTSGDGTVSYEYDAGGNLTVLRNADGTTVRHDHDVLNREISVTDAANRTIRMEYDPAGRRISENRPNGTRAVYGYDPAGQVTSICWTGPGGAAVASFAYTYDAVGNKTRVVDSEGPSSFAYDALDRLTSATYPTSGTTTYTYDPAGNRTAMTVNGVTTSYSYNAANQQTMAGANRVTWDANGNMVSNGSTTYRHDTQNRLIGVERGGLVEQFSYNGADHRTSQGVNGTVTRYGYDLHRELPHVVTETSPTNAHVYGLGNQALWDASTDEGLTYYHQDAMGSTAALTRSDGTVLGKRTYDAFGAPRGPQVGTGSYWFNGEQYDPNSGLIYLRARYYDPTSGRFLEADPAAPDLRSTQSLNKYAYANNNPLRFVDPTGNAPEPSRFTRAANTVGLVILGTLAIATVAAAAYLAAPFVAAAAVATAAATSTVATRAYFYAEVRGINSIIRTTANCVFGHGMPTSLTDALCGLYLKSSHEKEKSSANSRSTSHSMQRMFIGPSSFRIADLLRTSGPGSTGHGAPHSGIDDSTLRYGLPTRSFGGSNWSASHVTAGGLSLPLGGAYIPLGYNPAAGAGGGNAAGGARFCTSPDMQGYCVVLGIGGYSNLTEYHLDRNIVSIENRGFHITLWDQQHLSGTPTYFDTSVSRLPADKANTTRSLRIERIGDTRCNPGDNGVILYRNAEYHTGGGCIFTQGSIPDLRPSTFDQDLNSVRFAGSFLGTKQVRLYRQPNYQDFCGSYHQNWADLAGCDDIAQSVEVLDYTPPPPTPVPPGTFYAGNAGPFATRDGPGSEATVDGRLDGEWRQTPGATGLGFSWPHPVTTGHIVVWDRLRNPEANGIGVLSIGFSDGTILKKLDMIVQGPRCVDVTFPAKTISWVNVIPIETYAPGYREVQIWATTGQQSSADACPNRRTAEAVPGSFPAPTVIAPPDLGPPGPPIDDLVVSSLASESSDGIAHDAGRPFILPAVVRYRTLTIKHGAHASVAPWNGTNGGSTGIAVDGHVQIDGVLDLSHRGYRGGPPLVGAEGGMQGESHLGMGKRSVAPNGGGGGGAEGADIGGGGGGHGSVGEPGLAPPGHRLAVGGQQYGDPSVSTVYMGSGGGSSGAQSTSFGGAGGAGGGSVDLKAGSIRVTGRVSVDGQDGSSVQQGSDATNVRGGGGGSGGSVRLAAATIDVGPGLVTAAGGAGGYGIHDNRWPINGGAGGVGRIRLEYTSSYSGTTSPAASAARVTTEAKPDLVVATDPALSSDGQAHGPANPFLITAGSRYADVTVHAGAYATGAAWNGTSGGTLSFVASGIVRVDGTLTAEGKGFRGGPAVGGANVGIQGESIAGPGARSNQPNAGGGGGGSSADSGGGGGGHGAPGDAGQGPPGQPPTHGGGVYGDPTLASIRLGSGGGSSGAQSAATGAPGGSGGGAIDITAEQIVVTGRLSADGQAATSVSQSTDGTNMRAGGGGSGGSIRLHAPIIDTSAGSVTAVGGAGGFGIHDGRVPASGGRGGDGRIRIEYAQSAVGTATPTASQVSYAGPLDHLAISHANATSVAGGAGPTYVVKGFDNAGTSLGDLTASTSFAIAPDGSCSGATCSATTSGVHTVTATNAGRSTSATLLVVPAAVDRLAVSPLPATIVAGEAHTYSVRGVDQYGNDTGDITAEASFSIAPDGSCTGPRCTAVRPGPHTISITSGGRTSTAPLTVVAGPIDRLILSPPTSTIVVGAEQAYSTHGYDQHNNDLGDVTGSTVFAISPDGSCSGSSCTASTAGPHTVLAMNGLRVSTATITVTPAPATPLFTAASPPARASVGVPYTYTFAATGHPAPTFAVTSGSLPGGLVLNGGSGQLSGTPVVAGTYSFTITAANGVGPDASSPSTISVQPSFNVNGRVDRSVYRGGAWHVEGQATVFFGLPGDVPVHGDYDGSGAAEPAVYRDGAWYVEGQETVFFGLPGDVPVPGDYDGDGATDRAVFRGGAWYVDGQASQYLGLPGDVPVPGDYDGDGATDRAVFRDGVWYVEDQGHSYFGLPGDIPVPGDYGGDDATDRAVYRAGAWYVEGLPAAFMGLAGDVPVPGDYDGDGDTERAVYRDGVWYVEDQAPHYFGVADDIPLPLPSAIYRRFFS